MDNKAAANRRSEDRLRYNWPVWINVDPGSDRVIQGQMVDLNSHAAAFTFCCHEGQPWVHQHLTTRFAVPQGGPDSPFEIADLIRDGHVHRVDQPNPFLWRVVMQFREPLPFKPAQAAVTPEQIAEPLLG